MIRLSFYFRTALNNLRRGGQMSLVALLCIIFGVMSLVSLNLVSETFMRAVLIDPSEQFGGDLSLSRQVEGFISPEHAAELQALQEEGIIDDFTLASFTQSLVFRLRGSGEVHFTAAGIGVDPSRYPLAGNLTISQPGNVGLATLLQEPGDLVITRDLVEENNLGIGDVIILADQGIGAPVECTIRGIASDTPNHQGSKIYYNHDTAALLTFGRQNGMVTSAVNTALAMAADPEEAAGRLSKNGWIVSNAPQLAKQGESGNDMFETLLKGAGIMGLMVGGVGIANTMQVLLRRRQREIAIWKTLGYRDGDLQTLFAVEAAVLGTAGSLLGAGLGVLVSLGLFQLFRRTSNLLVTWSFTPGPLLTGVLVGILTTVIFAMWAIVSSSKVHPLALLRDEPVRASRLPWFKAVALLVLLSLPFGALTSWVMGDVIRGAGVILFALAGCMVLGSLFASLVWLLTHLLPTRSLPLVHMAKNSLRRRGLSLVFAMIALFAGIVAMAMGVVVTESADTRMAAFDIPIEGYLLRVVAPYAQDATVHRAVQDQEVGEVVYAYRSMLRDVRLPGQEDTGIQPVLIGLTGLGEYEIIEGTPWGNHEDGVYVPRHWGLTVGEDVAIVLMDGSNQSLPVAGVYDLNWERTILPSDMGILAPVELSLKLAQPDLVTAFIRVPSERASSVSAALGGALPDATVINLIAYVMRFVQNYRNLFILALAMSGLALLAGALLVANSVSLAMLDRRYEIGVLKAMGYSQVHILTTLAVEYTLVALIAVLAGLVSVQGFLTVLAMMNDVAASLLVLSPGASLIIVLLGVGLVLLAVLAATWGPTRISPAVVLNHRV